MESPRTATDCAAPREIVCPAARERAPNRLRAMTRDRQTGPGMQILCGQFFLTPHMEHARYKGRTGDPVYGLRVTTDYLGAFPSPDLGAEKARAAYSFHPFRACGMAQPAVTTRSIVRLGAEQDSARFRRAAERSRQRHRHDLTDDPLISRRSQFRGCAACAGLAPVALGTAQARPAAASIANENFLLYRGISHCERAVGLSRSAAKRS